MLSGLWIVYRRTSTIVKLFGVCFGGYSGGRSVPGGLPAGGSGSILISFGPESGIGENELRFHVVCR
jgi:hypothetical protein